MDHRGWIVAWAAGMWISLGGLYGPGRLGADCGRCERHKEGGAACAKENGACEATPEAVKALKEDINLLNLVNGLHLSSHQVRHLLAEARAVAEGCSEERTVPPSDPRETAALERDLKAMRDLLARGAEVPKELAERVDKAGRPAPSPRAAKKDGARDRQRAAEEVASLLFPAQREVIVDYKACLIPPKNLKNPVRAGQANDSSAAESLLNRLRKIPAARYEADEEAILDRVVAEAEERHGTFCAAERGETIDRLRTLARKVRALPDVEYELGKGKLGQEMAFLSKKEQVKQELELYRGGKEEEVRHKIAAFLLHPRIAPLLEERLKQMESFEIGKPMDLETISAAANCKSGTCAIDDAGHRTARQARK